jgi:hypothetical protein
MLVARYAVGKNHNGHVMWLCDCDCGGTKVTPAGCIISNFTTSCGCAEKDINKRNAAAWKDKNRPSRCKSGGLFFVRDDDINGYKSECGHYQIRKDGSRWQVYGVVGQDLFEFVKASTLILAASKAAKIESALIEARVQARAPLFRLLEMGV